MTANLSAFSPDWTTPPGSTIKRIMSKRGLSVDELAMEIEFSEAKTQGLIDGEVYIDEELAKRLSSALGASHNFWINRERQYRDDLMRLNPNMQNFQSLDAFWAKAFPWRDMCKLGWLPSTTTKQNFIETLQKFFDVRTPEDWVSRYKPTETLAAFRTSPSFESSPPAVTAWLRWAEIKASEVECNPWNRDALIASIADMRKLTRRNHPSKFIPDLRRLCASAGVALVIAPAPDGCRASGATRFLSPEKALIVLSLRFRSDDHFWFTFFHEVGHLVLHSKDDLFLEDNSDVNSVEEIEANEFSANTLVPSELRDEMLSLKPRSDAISRFSIHAGISSGIVVGQLQHVGRLGRNQMNRLKRRYQWDDFNL
ncbi:ImmA/IrrE family metallo-endopeptidase [Agrobacterium vitis]|uniref:ImmA/IrrE family metallo-endopeptidase n=1 Tax=Agrobacterium vitis TaxID=373 RepID=A0ABD6G7K1_AGRVI|nr:ImmA/IrrE family metallo-endopeptidase [Agrobacterium vitis]MUO78155.1 ImmA/IrrE family metallo-endopeptidase [Agrobacterium vitis]MUO94032.1 ImmA/IrrE family metallo-endopeptidase [Agrobacterium vitis]MUP03513.1 ImmA/IrrE family metallo-endopeptidase [Agrobacterium vitis]MUZ85060.1 ImmA/IrrE family metallo-endopeptidase [Agrobacterium vitis]MVA10146.1 ImmA/IrrE family metallo-endopeptidase [Agrobacterium vitis]